MPTTVKTQETLRAACALLPSIVRATLRGETPPPLTEEQYSYLYPVARAHDLAHMVGALLQEGDAISPADRTAYQKEKNLALYRHSLFIYEETRIAATLDKAGIPYIFLKGSVLRRLYPEPWLRTSSDVDVLVPRGRISDAISALVSDLSYQVGKEGGHDYSLCSPDHVHVELHFCLTERDAKTQQYLDAVFDKATKEEGMAHQLSDELFYLYLTSHAMKHFILGGCGVRTLADFYLMKEKLGYTPQRFSNILTACGLYDFASGMVALADAWFGEGRHTPLTEKMASYILEGGIYGNAEQLSLMGQAKAGGKLGYALRRIFLPFGEMKEEYPVLHRAAILLPFCHIHRWLMLLFRPRRRREALYRMRQSNTTLHASYRRMLKELGLVDPQ